MLKWATSRVVQWLTLGTGLVDLSGLRTAGRGGSPRFTSAASGYCSGVADPCNSVFSSTTCQKGEFFGDSCPLIVESCEVICESKGADGYNSPCRCTTAPLGCSGGSLSVCESSVTCSGFPECEALTQSLDCLFTKGCEWDYGTKPPTLAPAEAGTSSLSPNSTALADKVITLLDGEEIEVDNVVNSTGDGIGIGVNVSIVSNDFDGGNESDGVEEYEEKSLNDTVALVGGQDVAGIDTDSNRFDDIEEGEIFGGTGAKERFEGVDSNNTTNEGVGGDSSQASSERSHQTVNAVQPQQDKQTSLFLAATISFWGYKFS